MKFIRLPVGEMSANCYLVWDEGLKDALIIDPGDAAEYILNKIRDLDIRPVSILATHGHFDHVMAATELSLAFNIPFYINELDLGILKNIQSSCKHFTGLACDPPPIVGGYLKDGKSIQFGKEKLVVMETPGHTPGSVCLLGDDYVFTGDTIFKNAIGRTDFSYSSKDKMKKSLERLFKLPKEIIVLPGHGEETIIGETKF